MTYVVLGRSAPSDEPVEHPLSRGLGPDWRWLSDPYRDTVVILHVRGAWVEVSAEAILHIGAAEASAISIAMDRIAEDRGQHVVTIRRTEDGYTAEAHPA